MGNSEINILLALNEKYLTYAKVMLLSLSMHYNGKLNVYLAHTELSEEQLADFSSFVSEKCRGRLLPIKIDRTLFLDMPVLKHFTPEAYYRLDIVRILPEALDRVLWLDADIIVRRSIEDFYNTDFRDKLLVVCRERHSKGELNKQLGLSDEHIYFNSGVILYNLERMRQFNNDGIFEYAEKYREQLVYVDQDLLNMYYQDYLLYENEEIYNMEVLWQDTFTRCELNSILNNTAIIHYTGHNKPWHWKFYSKTLQNLYWEYARMLGEKRRLRDIVLGYTYRVFRVLKKSFAKTWKALAAFERLKHVYYLGKRIPHYIRLKIRNGKNMEFKSFPWFGSRFRVRVIEGGKVEIGEGFTCERDVFIHALGGKVLLGDNVYMNSNTNLVARSKINIGNGTIIGYNAVIIDHNHTKDKDSEWAGYRSGEITIGNNVWIGANCTITSGVKIGDGAVIGANAAVTKDIPAFTLAGGVPAKVIRNL